MLHSTPFIHTLVYRLYLVCCNYIMSSRMGVSTLVAGMFLTGCANSLL